MNKTTKLHENMFIKEKCVFFYKNTQFYEQNLHSTLKYVQNKFIHNLKTVSFQIYFVSLYMPYCYYMIDNKN